MDVNMKFSFLIILTLISSASVLSQTKPKTSKAKTSDKDVKYINRMRSEIQKAENSPNDIEPLRRHSAVDIVLIPNNMPPVIGQENALNLMKQFWAMF
jgi:hypothetical protein